MLVRSVVWLSGLRPDPNVLLSHWQFLDLTVLASDPFGSLWYLHSQAPLFNAILAAAIALVGPDAVAVSQLIQGVWVILTLVGAGLLIAILRRLGMSVFWAAVTAFAISCSPSTLYYETYIFYPHLSAFLVLCFVHACFVAHRYRALQGLAALVALAWLWAVFHPVFVVAAGYLFGRAILMQRRAMLGAICVATLLAAVPTLKNAMVFGVPSASSWLPLNLEQTVRIEPESTRVLCSIGNISGELSEDAPGTQDASRFGAHPVLTDRTKTSGRPNLNAVFVLERSRACMPVVVDALRADPLRYLKKRLQRFFRSHSLRPYQYFFPPLGWDRIAPFETLIERTYPASGLLSLLGYVCLIGLCWRAARTGPYRREMSVILLLILYFTAATHLLNGGEQQRMRYTIEPLYAILAFWWLCPLRGPQRLAGKLYRVVSVRRRRT